MAKRTLRLFKKPTLESVHNRSQVRVLGGHVLFDRGQRGPALQRFDICGNRVSTQCLQGPDTRRA